MTDEEIIRDCIRKLALAAEGAGNPDAAMKYAQAALNLSNSLPTMYQYRGRDEAGELSK